MACMLYIWPIKVIMNQQIHSNILDTYVSFVHFLSKEFYYIFLNQNCPVIVEVTDR